MNSLMSILMSASSLPNMNSASALASSVLPTPVGPRKMNEPMGRLGSLRPARARRTALEIVSIASFWPMTRLWSASSMCSSRSDSSWAIRVTGMPVHIATTWAMSSSPTTGVFAACWACQSLRSWSTAARAEVSASRSCWARSYSWSLTAASFSLETRSSSFWAALSSGGDELWRRRTRLDGLVDEVDRLVRQVAVGDVADGQVGGGLDAPRP